MLRVSQILMQETDRNDWKVLKVGYEYIMAPQQCMYSISVLICACNPNSNTGNGHNWLGNVHNRDDTGQY